MEQQYITRLAEAYKRGYEKRYVDSTGSPTKNAPEMKMHYFKVKEDIPRVQVVLSFLRKHQPFVWNATNITAQMRESLVGLFGTYHARVRIVYLETDWHTLQERNRQREEVVPLDAVEKMLGKMVLPETSEARRVEWIGV